MKIIKKYIVKKIVIRAFSILLLLLFYLVPTNKKIKINESLKHNSNKVIFLIDKDNYVSRVITYFDSKTIEDEIKKRIDVLINGNEDTILFNEVIPKYTKINKIKIDKNNLYIDFNEYLLNVNKYMEEKIIESIVYSLCEINGIDNIYISINNEPLKYLPNSKKEIPYPLNKSIGINKEYNISSFNNIQEITVFFYHNSYYVPVTKITNDKDEKLEIIIKELKSSINEQNNLYSFLDNNIKLIDYKINTNSIELIFNDNLSNKTEKQNIINNIIAYSIFENYDVNKITIKNEKDNISYDINR